MCLYSSCSCSLHVDQPMRQSRTLFEESTSTGSNQCSCTKGFVYQFVYAAIVWKSLIFSHKWLKHHPTDVGGHLRMTSALYQLHWEIGQFDILWESLIFWTEKPCCLKKAILEGPTLQEVCMHVPVVNYYYYYYSTRLLSPMQELAANTHDNIMTDEWVILSA